MSGRSRVNPFYVMLVIVGVAFVVTATSYGMVAFLAARNPAAAMEYSEHPLWRLMNERGGTIMAVELTLLAVFSFAAMGTDSFWSRTERRKLGSHIAEE